jgi:hypothetical protein
MTLKELCAYLGHVSPDDVLEHVKAKRLPAAEAGFSVYDPGAHWSQAEVDRALDKARQFVPGTMRQRVNRRSKRP